MHSAKIFDRSNAIQCAQLRSYINNILFSKLKTVNVLMSSFGKKYMQFYLALSYKHVKNKDSRLPVEFPTFLVECSKLF